MDSSFSAAFRSAFSKDALASFLPLEDRFALLTDLLITENKKTNLTAITDPADIVYLHYADSLSAAQYLPEGARVIDVGCGGGFPVLPLAIARPDLHFTALDSTAKKLQFVASAAQSLGLTNVEILNARAEEAGHDPAHRGRYTAVVSRAVARMQVLCELCLPFLSRGGLMVALKGATANEELEAAAHGIFQLGGQFLSNASVDLGDSRRAAAHNIIILSKVKETPGLYPRNFSQISKKPL